jgi:hypothetical protein
VDLPDAQTPPEGGVFVCRLIAMHARVARMCPDDGHEKTRSRGFFIQ